MKSTRNVLFALLLLGGTAGASFAQAGFSVGVHGGSYGGHGRASVDLGFFYDNLASYGNWIERPSYGWVWTPRAVSSSWRPYQAGHWVWSDEGWTWLSDEPYGWATYHYGRWYQDPEIGWAWVPGNDWAPAWVSWQEGNDNVGWAPLPPGANVNASYNSGYDNGDRSDNGYRSDNSYDGGPGYDSGYGYDGGYDNGYGYDGGYGGNDAYYSSGYGYGNYAYGIAPAAYLFVPTRYFLSVDLFDFFLPWGRVSSFFRYTHNCTDYGFYGGRYFNRGVPFEHVQRYYGGHVPRYQLSELGGFRGRGYQVEGNRVAFFRPQVDRSWRGSPADRPGARGSVVSANQFRAGHPDRQRNYAQNYAQNFGRNNGNSGWNNQRGSQWQNQDRTGRQGFYNGGQSNNGQRWQNQPNRQRQYEVPGAQNRAYQGQVDRQRQYVPRQQQYQQRSYDNQRWQQQRQASPSPQRQQQQYRNEGRRGSDNRGQSNRGQNNRGQNNRGQNNGRRQHGG